METESVKAKTFVKSYNCSDGITKRPDAWAHHNVQFYLHPPEETISLGELRNLAEIRQKVLNAVESVGLRYPKQSNDYQRELDFALRSIDFKIAITTMNTTSEVKNLKIGDKDTEMLEYRRQDYLSHFILRLAYSSTPDLRQWYIQQEVDLFRFRLASESPTSIKDFLRLYGIAAELLSAEASERQELEPILKQLHSVRQAPAGSEEPDPKTDIYKVRFTEATELVKARKVFLRRGFAYVPYSELASVLVGRFRSNLSRALAAASKNTDVEDDARLLPILKSASNRNAALPSGAPQSHTNITADMIVSLVQDSFPPCMRVIYKHVHTKHHLRHHGRMQMGLFLKAIGMSMEESLKFWKKEFSIDADTFEKKYAYNVRHNYGMEGKRADYSAYTCVKIINMATPGPSDCHGCPFKTMSSDVLQQHLENWGLSTEQQATVVEQAQRGHYARACSRYFEYRHGVPEDSRNQLISHPNQYFDESRKQRLSEIA